MLGETAEIRVNPLSIQSLPTRAFTTVEIFAMAGPVLDAWADLESCAPCSIYQTRAWLLPWADTLGRKAGISPRYVLVRGDADRPVALLCLGIYRRGPFTIATWLGGKDSNFNMPLLRCPDVWTKDEVRRLVSEVANKTGDPIDLFILPNQPVAWQDVANPFAALPNSASPSAAYGMRLPGDPEVLFSNKLSKDARKKLRKKEARLADLGPVIHRIAQDDEERRSLIDTFLAQKNARFQVRRIVSDFTSPQMRAFIEQASGSNNCGIELHALYAGERVVAVYGGAAHRGQWSGMFNSFDGDEKIARSSPGDLLLMRIIAQACADGLTHFDLGIGEARYKAALCDQEIPMFDAVVPFSIKGQVYTTLVRERQNVKRVVKKSPLALAWARRIETALRRD